MTCAAILGGSSRFAKGGRAANIGPMEFRVLYITAGSRDEAGKVGRALVESRLAACANIIDGMASIYWWQGKLTEDREIGRAHV